jgi:hypothetical protein
MLSHLRARNEYPAWIATVAFYTALHSLERFLARRNRHPHDHTDRKNILWSYEPQLSRQILYDYLDMYDLSISARYDCISPTTKDIQDQLNRLARIDARVGPLV